MSLKPGYIEVFVFDNGTGDILDSNGFNYRDLTQMVKQMEEPFYFEGLEGLCCFKPKYSDAQTDDMGRVEVPGYWEFEEDNYTNNKKAEYQKKFGDQDDVIYIEDKGNPF